MNSKVLLIAAGLAYLFRDKLETLIGLTPAAAAASAGTASADATAVAMSAPAPAPLTTNTSTKATVDITPALQLKAATDPTTARLLGEDPRGFLSVDQWNYYFTEATGKPGADVGIPGEPPISAQTYQARKIAAGIALTGLNGWI